MFASTRFYDDGGRPLINHNIIDDTVNIKRNIPEGEYGQIIHNNCLLFLNTQMIIY